MLSVLYRDHNVDLNEPNRPWVFRDKIDFFQMLSFFIHFHLYQTLLAVTGHEQSKEQHQSVARKGGA
jgi:hypothetical protein